MSAGTAIKTPRVETCIASVMQRYPSDKSTKYFEAVHQELAPLARELEREVADLRAALEAAKIPPDRLQNWIDVIHDNERSMGDRLQSLSSIFGGLLRGDAVDKYPLQTIREQQPDSERDAARMDWLVQKIVDVRAELRYGSRFMFTSQAKYDDEEFVGTTLREQIDAAQQGEAQPLPGDKP